MDRIKRFFKEEKGTAEATSTVVMVAAVGIMLAAGLIAYYGGINGFFQTAQTSTNTLGTNMSSALSDFAGSAGS